MSSLSDQTRDSSTKDTDGSALIIQCLSDSSMGSDDVGGSRDGTQIGPRIEGLPSQSQPWIVIIHIPLLSREATTSQ